MYFTTAAAEMLNLPQRKEQYTMQKKKSNLWSKMQLQFLNMTDC